jgi:hypothetical protein
MHCSRVDAFRHRADPIMVDPPARGHAELGLTLTGRRKRMPRDERHPPRIVPDIEMRA